MNEGEPLRNATQVSAGVFKTAFQVRFPRSGVKICREEEKEL